MKQICKCCKAIVEVPEDFEIKVCLINDHWFEPIIQNNEEEEKYDFIAECDKSIIINPIPMLKLFYYVQGASGEISGFGKVRETEEHYIITDIRIFEQECTGAYTEIDDISLAKFVMELSQRGEKTEDWKLWWHSHHNFGVFFSGTDKDTIGELSGDREWLSICVNQRMEMIGRRDSRGNSEVVKCVCVPQKSKRIREICEYDINKKVKFERGWMINGK